MHEEHLSPSIRLKKKVLAAKSRTLAQSCPILISVLGFELKVSDIFELLSAFSRRIELESYFSFCSKASTDRICFMSYRSHMSVKHEKYINKFLL